MRRIKLSIPTPCKEDWNNMQKKPSGRFCGMCSKTVVDFTSMSDREMASTVKNSNGEICGRFMNDQLNREIIIARKPIPWLKYVLQVSFPAFLLSFKGGNQKVHLNNGTLIYQNMPIGTVLPETRPDLDSKPLKILKGRVLDEHGLPVQGATVTNLVSHFIAVTDTGGHFEMNFSDPKNERLSVASHDFETIETNVTVKSTITVTRKYVTLGMIDPAISGKQKMVKPHSTEKKINDTIAHQLPPVINYQGITNNVIKPQTITGNELCGIAGGVIAVPVKSKNIALVPLLKHVYDTLFSGVTVYPNPVTSGQTLNISLPKSGAYKISLIDISGIVLKETKVTTYDNSPTVYFPVGQIKAATYFIRLSNETTGKTITKKIIVY